MLIRSRTKLTILTQTLPNDGRSWSWNLNKGGAEVGAKNKNNFGFATLAKNYKYWLKSAEEFLSQKRTVLTCTVTK